MLFFSGFIEIIILIIGNKQGDPAGPRKCSVYVDDNTWDKYMAGRTSGSGRCVCMSQWAGVRCGL